MKPRHIGLPAKFKDWRKGQERAIRSLLFSDQRFKILNIPVGGGKSATYMANALINDSDRTAVVTSTRALQEQLNTDFESIGLQDIRGRQNYVCDIDESRTAADAKCTAGAFCDRSKIGGCGFYDTRNAAKESRIVSTNYSYWLHDQESANIGFFGSLVLDEAHVAPESIERFAAVSISDSELRRHGLTTPDRNIHRWGPTAIGLLQERRYQIRTDARVMTHSKADQLRELMDLEKKIARLCRLSEHEWLMSRKGSRYRWDLINPASLAEDLLFRGATNVVLSSATVNKKTIELLGVDSKNVKVIEQDSTFPVNRRPIYYWPVARAGYKMDQLAQRRMREAIDAVISERLDRKGVIHSVSYARTLEIVRNSKFRDSDIFLVHEQGRDLDTVLKEFRRRGPGTVLISPAITTGIDLPYDQCEYAIIPKMPFPDMRDALVKAKKERDKDYLSYITLQHLVQSVGRGMRAADDYCECFILDAHFGWLKGGYWTYLPRWFQNAIRTLPAREAPPRPQFKIAA